MNTVPGDGGLAGHEPAARAPLAYSVVIPCYNEEHAIAETIEHLLDGPAEHGPFELIVVNDGSTDGTSAILQGMAGRYDNLRVLDHAENRGYGASLKAGIRVARAELIAITDADGTYPNDRLGELVAACADHDMVVGARVADEGARAPAREFTKSILRRWMVWIARRDIPDINSGMRVFRKSVVEDFLGILPDGFSFTVTITLAMLTNYRPTRFIPIEYHARIGQSKIKPVRDTLQFIALILRTGTYFAPLRVFLPVVGMLALLLLVSLLYDMFHLGNLTDKTVILFLFCLNTSMFALLADMIDKRSMR